MSNDPIDLAGLVRRRVGTGERAGVPTRTTAATRIYRTDRHDLWDAVTNGERIPRWFLPITGTLEVGGRYQLEGNASGTIETCEPPSSFSVTWEFSGSTSWLTVTLTPVDDGTELELAHESPAYPTFWNQYGPGAAGLGWDLGLLALSWHAEDGDEFGPDREAAFTASPEGAAFLGAAGRLWGDAAVADGDDPTAAAAAVDRSVAFYLPTGNGSEV